MNDRELVRFKDYLIIVRNGDIKNLISFIDNLDNPLHSVMKYPSETFGDIKESLETIIEAGEKHYGKTVPVFENGLLVTRGGKSLMEINPRLYVKMKGSMLLEIREMLELVGAWSQPELVEYFNRLYDENEFKAKIASMNEVDLKEEFLTTAKDFQRIFFEAK